MFAKFGVYYAKVGVYHADALLSCVGGAGQGLLCISVDRTICTKIVYGRKKWADVCFMLGLPAPRGGGGVGKGAGERCERRREGVQQGRGVWKEVGLEWA